MLGENKSSFFANWAFLMGTGTLKMFARSFEVDGSLVTFEAFG
jgi:hypothetical protein